MGWMGKIILPDGREAILQESGEWVSKDKILAQYLNLSFDPKSTSALGLPTGWAVVSQAASALKGEAKFPFKLQPLLPGEVS